jgi:adenosylcobyric acid synthase
VKTKITRKKSLKAPCLAVFGTGSDVGKSVIVTGLCRYFADRGIRVTPFKAQNMSNNAGVTPEGLEIGRAQIVQAEAAGIPPHVDMNPILLKPTSEIGSQIVRLGKALANTTAATYQQKKQALFETALSALNRLRRQYELVIMEGAGSCAEVNLMDHDIVNFKMAESGDAPVILVADIHRGGVFAQIIGTLACLPPHRRNRIAGFLINRFRGDLALFDDGVDWIEKKTGMPGFGVVPWFNHFHIEAEDSVVIEQPRPVKVTRTDQPALAVIRLPHIANFNDFDPLADLNELDFYFIERRQDLSMFAAVILPGSKNTRFDLKWLKKTGWADELAFFAAQKGNILGVCGGYQMMGQWVHDPDGLEGKPGSSKGLGLLPVESTLKAPKTTTLTRFSLGDAVGSGYEIHMGFTRRSGGEPLTTIIERNGKPVKNTEGCRISNSGIMGTYLHGLFDSPSVLRWWLEAVGLNRVKVSDSYGPQSRDRNYRLLAEHLSRYVDLKKIETLL